MEFLIIALLTLLNSFFALVEIALVSAKKSRLETLAQKWDRRATRVLELQENPEQFLSSVQVGITLIGIVSGAYGGAAIADSIEGVLSEIAVLASFSEPLSLILAIGLITYFSIVIGELVPKTIAMNHAEGIALFSVSILRYFMLLTTPFVWLLSTSTSLILRTFRIQVNTDDRVSEEELLTLLKNAGDDGTIDREETQIHHNVFSFGDQIAKSIVTHRAEIEYVDLEDSHEEILTLIQESIHSKFLVSRDGSLDRLVGVISARDFLENYQKPGFTLMSIITEPIRVHENTSALKILSLFKTKKQYLAVVIDEYGGTEGIITLHDLIEVIIGDIPEEDGEGDESIMRRENGEYLISGKTLIYELNQYFQSEILDDASYEYTTVAGAMMGQFGHLPKVGDRIEFAGYRWEIVDMDGIRIDKIAMSRVESEEEK